MAYTTNTTCSVALFESNIGNQEPKTNTNLTYNANTGFLTATKFVGDVSGSDISGEFLDLSGNATVGGTLFVTGATTINNNVLITGDLSVNGVMTTINSTSVSIEDPVFVIGDDTLDDNLDRGIKFKWNAAGSAKFGFMGYDDSISKFVFIPDATEAGGGNVFSGNKGTLVANLAGNADAAT